MSRQAKKAPPVFTYEELAASPSMSGLVSFLNLPTHDENQGVHQFPPRVVSPLGAQRASEQQVVDIIQTPNVIPLGATPLPPEVLSPLGVNRQLECQPVKSIEAPTPPPLGAEPLPPGVSSPLGANRDSEHQVMDSTQPPPSITPPPPLPPRGESPLGGNGPIGPPAKEKEQPYTPSGLTPPSPTARSVELRAIATSSGGYTPRPSTAPRLPKSSPKQISAQWVSLSTGVIYDVSRVSRVDIAQQSMALGEERFYETIWRCAGSYTFHIIEESKHIHTFRAGVLALSKIARLNIKSIKDLLPKLIEKKILRVIADGDVRANLGKTYEIYSYEEILRRQEESGLTFVIKNGRAVEFVQPASPGGVTPLATQRSNHPRGETPPRQEHPQRLGVMPLHSPRGDTTPHIGTETFLRQTSSSVRSLLQAQLPTFDDSAVEHLWADCRKRVPDVTPDEVRCLFAAKLPQSFARGIENRNGFLLRVVPVSCTPAAISELRQSREMEQPDSTTGAGNYPVSSEDEIVRLEEMLDAMPNHPQAGEWLKSIDALRERN